MVVVVKTPEQPDYGSEIRSEEKVVQPAPNARQGVTGHNARTVLTVSLIGVIVLFAVVYFAFFAP